MPRSVDIWDACRDTLQGGPAAELHTLLRTLPGVDCVIAGKLLAAKRPRLIPILDTKVRGLVQPPTSQFWISMWDELSDESRRTTVAKVCADAPSDVSLLRRIDVALWMAASRTATPTHPQRILVRRHETDGGSRPDVLRPEARYSIRVCLRTDFAQTVGQAVGEELPHRVRAV